MAKPSGPLSSEYRVSAGIGEARARAVLDAGDDHAPREQVDELVLGVRV